jgi:hypothetical protein
MIKIDNLIESDIRTEVKPSNMIFTELGKNTYNYNDLISELIDNSLAARRSDRRLFIRINIYTDDSGKPVEFNIIDNANGIEQEKLGLAITPAGQQSSSSLNEHGLGMKQAVAAIGKLNYLATKVRGEENARVVREFTFGNIKTYFSPFEFDSGTEISVIDIKPIVICTSSVITRTLKPYLGARYRRFLKPDNPIMDLVINIISKPTSKILYNWKIEEEKPVYFHPSTRNNKPVILGHKLIGEGWEAALTFGYAPQSEGEYNELGISVVSKYHPYHVSQSKQGLDIIRHDRVILFSQLSEIGIVPSRHPDYNNIRGELDLISGFSTAITKNYIIEDDNFRQFIDRVRRILTGEDEDPHGTKKNYLKGKNYPEQIPEKLLRDRLADWLENNPLNKKKSVSKEFVVQGIEGYIDILADNETWELKTDLASALDIFQLFMYMDVGGFEKGFMVCKSASPGALIAAKHIKEKHKKEIIIATFDQFPITQPPSSTEREEYY